MTTASFSSRLLVQDVNKLAAALGQAYDQLKIHLPENPNDQL